MLNICTLLILVVLFDYVFIQSFAVFDHCIFYSSNVVHILAFLLLDVFTSVYKIMVVGFYGEHVSC